MELLSSIGRLEATVKGYEQEKMPLLLEKCNRLTAALEHTQKDLEDKLRELSEATQKGQTLSVQLQQTLLHHTEETQKTKAAHDSTMRDVLAKSANVERERDVLLARGVELENIIGSLEGHVKVCISYRTDSI